MYTIDELRQLITESSNEFKAKMGPGVESENKKNNSKSYSDAEKNAKNYDGGLSEKKDDKPLPKKMDGNKTTLDYSIDGELDDKTKETWEAQAQGYHSLLDRDNGIETLGDFEKNKKIYKNIEDAGKEMADNVAKTKARGLSSHNLKPEDYAKNGMYTGSKKEKQNESKKIAVLNFKGTTFVNESHMISRIPDDFKKEGNRFKVKDAGANEFIVEWTEGEANILSYENTRKLNESLAKFHRLSGYNAATPNKKSSAQGRLNEETEFNNIMNKVRTIIEK